MRHFLAYYSAELAAWAAFTGLLLAAVAVYGIWRWLLRRLT